MNILRLAYEYPPPWDGLAPGIYELTEAQRKLGNKVEVFSSQRFPRAVKRFSLFLTTAPAVLLGYLFYRSSHKVDIVHGHGHITCCFNLYRRLFGWLDKTPYVLHLHITAAGREDRARKKGSKLDFWTRYFEWPLHKFSDRVGCRVADAVICTSEIVKKEATKYYHTDLRRTFIVENGVNTKLFARSIPQPDGLTAKPVGFSLTERQNLLYVGALTRRKNVHLLIEALKFLPENYHLTIVGRGDDEYQKYLEDLVKKYNLHDRINFVGYVEYPKLPKYYKNADLLVLPSSYEGLPKVVLEALSCGIPVLASGFSIKEEIKGLSFLDELDARSLAARTKRIVESGEKVDVKKIRQQYDWSVKASEVQRVYDRIKS